MRRKFGIRGYISKGGDPYDILTSNILGKQVCLTEEGRNVLLKQVLKLECKQSIVLLFSYGFLYRTNRRLLTQQKIGDLFGVTSARIGQIEQKAIKRLRHKKRISILKQHIKSTT